MTEEQFSAVASELGGAGFAEQLGEISGEVQDQIGSVRMTKRARLMVRGRGIPCFPMVSFFCVGYW